MVAKFCCLFSTTFLTFHYTSLQQLASFWCAETHAGIHNYLRLSSHEMILKCSKGHTRSLRPGLGKTGIFASPTCLVAEAAVAERGNWCDWILAISFNTVRLMFLDPWMSRLDLQSGERSMDSFSMNFLRGQGIPEIFQDTLLGLNFLQPRWASYPAVMRLHQSRTSPKIQIDRMTVQGNNLPPQNSTPRNAPWELHLWGIFTI